MSDQVTLLPNGELVNFLIAGAQKSGTTALADYLRMHPRLFIPAKKEIHFFNRDNKFVTEPPDYNWYHAEFDGMTARQIAGDATPQYLYSEACAERIRAYNADMRLIFILRNPCDRAYSHWNMQRKRGRETLTFGEAIRTEAERLAKAPSWRARGWFAYLERGMYHKQLQRYLDCFPRHNLEFIKTEDLRHKHPDVLARVCDFIRVPVFDPMPKHQDSFSQNYDPMEKADREYLQDYFRPGMKSLEKMLGWDCSSWIS